MHSGMYRQPWSDNGNPRTKEPKFVHENKWVGNTEVFINYRKDKDGTEREKSRTTEQDSTLMFLGCMEVC